ncbi:hypothetical protein [Desulfatitalea alkaliphila]|jgi:hypothetical protein|uniref:Uncharacterized protein n=1 Tax=Desulfatitalea alkaliphila TaxID=2929485 RepID=A0AA41R5K0_9BACT|nr:hypothetical protein [Desulfatitalea alkaliphila]MCJ8501425.1 hypothetical protein [Desulfatitalea alkaliphila]
MYTYELPSGIEIELKEMTGAEEELLTNQRLIRNGEAINQVLRNCTVRLGENDKPAVNDILDLLSGDRLFALVKLRQISLGDEVELELTCPNASCRMTNYVTVNLEDLKVTPYTEEREFEFKLPGSKKAVRFGLLDGHKEKRLAALREPNISSAMMIRLIEIDGKAPSKKSLAEMPMRDRSALRQEMARVDAGIDTTVEVDCDGCGTRIRTRLEAEPAFLFPGVRL